MPCPGYGTVKFSFQVDMKRYATHKTVSAPASRSVGALALVLSVIAFLAKRFGLIEADVFVLSLAGAALIALLSLAMAFFAFQRIWTLGGPGVPAALNGALLGCLALVPPAIFLAMLVSHRGADDLSTDRSDPPELTQLVLSDEQPFLAWLNGTLETQVWPLWLQLSGTGAPEVAEAEILHPDIVSRRYRIPPGQLHVAGAKAIEDLDLRVVDELPPDLLDAPTRLQAEGQTRILGLKYDVALRVRPDPVGALLDVRSRSRTPLKDLRDNADHIRTVFAEIDKVLLETYGDLARLSVDESELEETGAQPEPLEEPRDTVPLPGFKPYFEGEDDAPADGLELTDLEG